MSFDALPSDSPHVPTEGNEETTARPDAPETAEAAVAPPRQRTRRKFPAPLEQTPDSQDADTSPGRRQTRGKSARPASDSQETTERTPPEKSRQRRSGNRSAAGVAPPSQEPSIPRDVETQSGRAGRPPEDPFPLSEAPRPAPAAANTTSESMPASGAASETVPTRTRARRSVKQPAPAPAREHGEAAAGETAPARQKGPRTLARRRSPESTPPEEQQATGIPPPEPGAQTPSVEPGLQIRETPPIPSTEAHAIVAGILAMEEPAAEMSQSEKLQTAEPAERPTLPPGLLEPPPRGRRNRRGGRNRREQPRTSEDPPIETPVPPTRRPVRGEETPTPETIGPIPVRPGAHLIARDGRPEIVIAGARYAPGLFFGNMEEQKHTQNVISELRHAARIGIHLHTTLVDLPCPLTEASDALEIIDGRLRAILDADPDGYVMPRVVFVPARGWRREYPTDIATYSDGATGDPSLTSVRFWQEAERSIESLIHHLCGYEWGSRIFGYHLERGEWFQPADLGFDRSIANRDAFRDWLREKYQHNLVALRAAWYDASVQFHTAEIPPAPTRLQPNRAFYETRRERCYVDFYEFTSQTTADRLIALARVVKRATENRALVSVCYGYTLEFGHPYSGHLALARVLACPQIDLLSGPPSYRDRKLGEAASYPVPVGSLALHGKLWISEDDTKTFLAAPRQDPDDFNPRFGDRSATEQAQMRSIGKALARGTGVNWMDLWGEGWLNDDNIWETLGTFTRNCQVTAQSGRPQGLSDAPDVIALIDEESLLHLQRGEPFFRKLTNGLRDTLQRAGISYSVYLQSDLLTGNFPVTAKLYLFLTPFRLDTEIRAAIKDKLQGNGRTLVWLYAPGTCEEFPSSGLVDEVASDPVGMSLRLQAWNSEVGSRVIEPAHAVTEGLASREIGTRERLSPSFYVDDPHAIPLAEYHGTGLISLAVKNLGSWKSVFVGDPGLSVELLRGICRYAGVPLWTPQSDDIVEIGNGWAAFHMARDGQRILRLPTSTGLYDVTERQLISDSLREHRFFARAGTSRLFCIGPVERFVRLGLPDATSMPVALRPKQAREKPAAPELHRATGDLDAARKKDLQIYEELLSLDVSALDLEETRESGEPQQVEEREYGAGRAEAEVMTGGPAEESSGGELLSNGRRRRRRGGRGRNRRRPGVQTDAEGGTLPQDNPPGGQTE